MPRAGQVKKREIIPDPIYNDRLVTRLINRVMKGGKKSLAERQVYTAFEIVGKKTGKDPLQLFKAAVDNVKPDMEVRPRRVGGASYQVPMPVRGDRKESLAIRWLITAAQSRSNREFHTFSEKLASELAAAAAGQGGAVTKKGQVHKMAEANRAFAHFRW